jgi:uncharacterized membrane protein
MRFQEKCNTFGSILADKVSDFVGSWTFIIGQTLFFGIWMALNLLKITDFDQPPFILLNLILGVEAAFTAPFIMMSQARQASKDRLVLEDDFKSDEFSREMLVEILIEVRKNREIREKLNLYK